jgi:type I restriction enzyme S subunit
MTSDAWFGDPPDGWTSAPLGYYFDVVLGKMLNASKESGQDRQAPYLAAGSIQPEHLILDETKTMSFSEEELGQYELRKNDIVVVEGGAGYGRSHLLRDGLSGWGFQNHVARLRSRGAVFPGFLLYCLKACLASGYIEANNRTATLPSLSRDVLRALPVPLPPAGEQRAIADYLDHETAKIDELIAEQRRLIEMLAERRRAVLDEVTSEAVGDWIKLKYLFTPSSESNFPDEEVLSVYRDYGVIPKASRDDNFNRTPENVERYLLVRPGDLVVNRMKAWQGSLGISDHRGIVSGDYEVARPSSRRLLPRFAHLFLRSPKMIAEYAVRSTGIRPSQWRLYWDQMGNIQMPVPSREAQAGLIAKIDEQINKIDSLIAEAERFIDLSRERRSALITAAVTGHLDVRMGAA